MDYSEAIEYLYSVRLFGAKLGLANTKHLLSNLGHPERTFFTVHVAGTNGKGSVCAMVSSILSQAGYRVGMFTSPHILSFRERMRVGSEMIAQEAVCRHLTRLLPVIKQMSEDPELSHPTFFEIVTALAVAYFAEKNVDIAVMETGMGGRLDATNALPSQIEVITTIGLEHTAYLGNSIAEIAAEKAGIIKQGATVVVGEQDEVAVEVIRRRAAEERARIALFGKDIFFRDRELRFPLQQIDVVTATKTYCGLVLPLLGRHQAVNCCLAIAAVEELQKTGVNVDLKHVYDGLRETRWPGRFEVIQGQPNYILDGACNPQACEALVETLSEVVGKAPLTLIAGFLGDKDYRRMCEILLPVAQNIILTEPKSQRALAVDELKKAALAVAPQGQVHCFGKVGAAVNFASKLSPSGKSFVCIAGSNYLLGPARRALGLDDLPEDFVLSELFDAERKKAPAQP